MMLMPRGLNLSGLKHGNHAGTGMSPIAPMPGWETIQPELDRNMASLTLSMLDHDFDLNVPLPGPKTDDSFGVNWTQHGLDSPFSPTPN